MGELEAFPAVFQIPNAAAAAIATSPPTTTQSPVQARVRCTALSLGLADRLAGCPALRAIVILTLAAYFQARAACMPNDDRIAAITMKVEFDHQSGYSAFRS
jgi:hypothetical protein